VVPIVATEKNYRKDLDIVNAPFFSSGMFRPMTGGPERRGLVGMIAKKTMEGARYASLI
jgi:hypothetical protein